MVSGGIRYRYLKNRLANEDNSIVAKGYFISDLNVNYQYKRYFGCSRNFLILHGTKHNTTESGFKIQSVEEIHFLRNALHEGKNLTF
jgi:hypothetical protein